MKFCDGTFNTDCFHMNFVHKMFENPELSKLPFKQLTIVSNTQGINKERGLFNDRWTFVKPYPQKNNFRTRRGSGLQSSDDRWDALIIEVSRPRWWTKMQVQHMCDLSGSHWMLIVLLMGYIFSKCGSLEISSMIDERSSSSMFRQTTFEPQTGIEPATFWWPVRRYDHRATKTQMVSQGASKHGLWS